MTEQEKKDWDELYQYVRKNIMKQDDKIPLNKHFVLRLKGLSNGKFMANKAVESMGEYTFREILITFMVMKDKIIYALDRNKGKFKTEQHKINYIMTIVEKNINDIKRKMDDKKKQKENSEKTNLEVHQNKTAKYTRKSKDIKNDRLKDLY